MTHLGFKWMAQRLHSVRGGVGRRRQDERSRTAESARGHRPACHMSTYRPVRAGDRASGSAMLSGWRPLQARTMRTRTIPASP